MRDFKEKPYTAEEKRVVEFIDQQTGGAIGGGDDPIGFLLASYVHIAELAAKQVFDNSVSDTV